MRKELEARPLVFATLSLICGLLSFRFPWVAFLPLAVLAVSLKPRFWGFSALGLALGIWLAPLPTQHLVQAPVEIADVGTVAVPPRPIPGGHERAIVQVQGSRYLLITGPYDAVAFQDQVFLRGVLEPLPAISADYWRRQGCGGLIKPTEPVKVLRSGPGVAVWGNKVRRSFDRFANRTMPSGSAEVVKALCFNQDADLPYDLRQNLARSGMIHVVSTSGLHVFLVAIALQMLLAGLPIPRWLKVCALLGILVVYVFASGLRPPMIRSVVMFGIPLLGEFFKKESDRLTNVAIGAGFVLVMLPYSLYDLGFQLSVVSTFALSIFLPHKLDHSLTWGLLIVDRLKTLGMASVVAQLATAPILAYHFQQVSLIGVLTNYVAAVVVPAATLGSLLAFALDPLLPGFAGFLMESGVSPLTSFLSGFANWSGSLPAAVAETPPIPLWLAITLCGLWITLWRPKSRVHGLILESSEGDPQVQSDAHGGASPGPSGRILR